MNAQHPFQMGTAARRLPWACGLILPLAIFLAGAAHALPTAEAGGPYTINEGQPLNLDGTGSSDGGNPPLTYDWDLDNNASYGDVTGSTPSVPWNTLKTYFDDDTHTIGLQVTDSVLATATDTATVTINNLAPTAEAGGDQTINEGQSLSLNGSGSSDPGGDTLTYSWDLNNDTVFGDVTGATPTIDWATLKTFITDGANTVTLQVTDTGNSANLSGTDTLTVTITNLAPTADAGSNQTINEGQSLSLDGSGSSDPGGDTLTYSWDLNNDTVFGDVTGATPTIDWATLKTFITDGANTVTLQVTDTGNSANLSGTDTITVTIDNLKPTAEADGPYTIDEGQILNLDASGSTDPGGDVLAYTWDFDNNGSYGDATGETPAVDWATLSAHITDGTHTIRLQVTDTGNSSNKTDTDTATVTINNLAPTADPGGPYAIDEGQTLDLDGSGSTDPGGDSLSYTWDLDANGTFGDVTGATPSVDWTTLKNFITDDVNTIYLRVTDTGNDTNMSNTVSTTVTITNLAPNAESGGPYTINEGQTLNLDASASSDPGGDVLTFGWDLNQDSVFDDVTTATPSIPWSTLITYFDDGVNNIILQVTDTGNTQNKIRYAFTTVTINNLAPVSDPGGPYAIDEGQPLALDASGSSDPGGDVLSYTWDLNNDGAFDDVTGETPAVAWATLATFITDGVNTIVLKVTDSGNSTNLDASTTTTVTITNHAPVSDAGGPYTIDEGATLDLDASASTDPGGDTMFFTWDLNNDTVYDDVIGETPSVPWVVLKTFFDQGTNTIRVRVTDSGNAVNLNTVDATSVTIIELPPVGVDDAYTTDEDSVLGVVAPGVLDNDSDPGGDPIMVDVGSSDTTSADGVTVVLYDDGSFAYDPRSTAVFNALPAGASRDDTFQYTVEDADGSGTAMVTITVNGVNDAPLLDDTGDMVLDPIDEDNVDSPGTLVSDLLTSGLPDPITDVDTGNPEGIAVTEIDIASGAWEYRLSGSATWESFGLISPANALMLRPEDRVRFVPNANFNGTVDPAITFRAWDQSAGTPGANADATTNGLDTPFSTATDTASMVVNPVNDPPVIVDDVVSTNEETPLDIDVLANDTDVEGLDPATVFVTVEPLHGSTGVLITGAITYIPDTDYSGPDSFVYRVRDIGDNGAPPLLDSATVNITVDATNDPPHAVDDVSATRAGVSVTINVLANDSDVETELDPNVTVVVDPTGGVIESIDPATGFITYRPNEDFQGIDQFTYRVFDQGLPLPALSADANVRVAVSQTEIVVDTLDDNDDGVYNAGEFSLREAFNFIADSGTIQFDPALFTPGAMATINLTLGELVAAREFAIAGPGAGQLEISADQASRVIAVTGGTLTISGITLTRGRVQDTLGGGIHVAATAGLILDGSIVSECTVEDTNGTADDLGGGIGCEGALQITNSTIANNTAGAFGGGIYSAGPLEILNTTISGNTAVTEDGGGIHMEDGTGELVHVTITGNSAETGGGLNKVAGALSIGNSILAGNVALSAGNDAAGIVTSLGNNLVQDIEGSETWLSTDLIGISAETVLETALNANGGTTPTHALLGDSPAIDAGNDLNASNAGLTTDQRGLDRFVGTADIGAYEVRRFLVDLQTDENDADLSAGDLSLREAVDATLPGDIIEFGFTGEIVLDPLLGEILIDNGLALVGPGAGQLSISGGNAISILYIPSTDAQAVFAGVTLRDAYDTVAPAGDGRGGPALFSFGTVRMTECVLIGNQSDVLDGGAIQNRGAMTLTRCVLQDNMASNLGGAIANWGGTLTLLQCTLSNNQTEQLGGALMNLLNGVVTVRDSTFESNHAYVSGALHNSVNGTVTVLNSSFIDNAAASDGGAMLNAGTLHMINSTLSGNRAERHGGGLHQNGSNATLVNCTLTNNLADAGDTGFGEGGGINSASGSVTLHNTVVAGNFDTVDNLGSGNIHPDISGNVATLGSNLLGNRNGAVGITDGVNGDHAGTGTQPIDPALGPLANYGGVVSVHIPRVQSPLIDQGDNDAITSPPFDAPPVYDQRGIGFDRVVDGDGDEEAIVDIGAVEYIPTQPVFTSSAITDATEDTLYEYSITLSDQDLDEVFSITAPTLPYWLTFTDNGDGTALLTGTPGNEEVSPYFDVRDYDVVIQVTDWANQTVSQVFTLTLAGVNDAPVTVDDTGDTAEDTPIIIPVLNNDSDIDGDLVPASVMITSGPANGLATINPETGEITYTPNLHYNGGDSFVYQVTDDGTPEPFLSTSATVTLTIAAVNDPPVTMEDAGECFEDDVVTVDVLANDSDVDGNLVPGTVSVTEGPANGTVSIDPATGAITYTPNHDFNGTDSFIYSVTDDGSPLPAESATASVALTVLAINDPPATVDDTAATDEDVPIVVPVLLNDTDVDGAILPDSVVVTEFPDHGAVSINPATGDVTYTPNLNYNGPDSFVYEVSDDGSPQPATVSFATVNLTVNAINDPPAAMDDAAVTNEDEPVVVNVLENDTDVDGNLVPSTVVVVQTPANGTATVEPATGTITYTPNLNFNGADSFTYSVTDDGAPLPEASSVAAVQITVIPVNDPPIVTDDTLTTEEDTPGTVLVLTNDSDVDGDLLPDTVLITVLPEHGSTTVVAETGAVIYTPALNYNGTDAFTYQVTDNGSPLPAQTTAGTVTVTILAINDAPHTLADTASTNEDTPAVIPVLDNDSDVDGNLVPDSVAITTPPQHGATSIDPNTGAITYTPNLNYNGPDAFVYSVTDDGSPLPAMTSTASVAIDILAVNDPPAVSDDAAVTLEDESVVVNVLGNDSDVDGNLVPASVAITAPPANGTTSVNPVTGAVTYTPNLNWHGTDSFTYRVTDDGAPLPSESTTGLVTITVNAVNDAPATVADSANTDEDTPVTVDVLANDSDVDGALVAESVVVTQPPQHGAAVVNPATGAITYTPAANYNGNDAFEYQVTDDGSPLPAQSSLATVTLIINAINDPPDARTDSANTEEDTPVVIDVLANDEDVDGNLVPGSVTVTRAPLHGSTAVNPATGGITYTPSADYNGNDSFLYAVTDDGSPLPAQTSEATVLINIGAVNDTLTANDDTAATNEDTPVTVDVLANDTDIDGNVLPATVSITQAPASGTAVADPVTGSITYTPNANFNGNDSFVYVVQDDGTPEPVRFDTATVSVHVAPVNDAPVAAALAHYDGFQETALPLSGITVADLDADELGEAVLEVNLSVLHGTLHLTEITGLTQVGNGTSAITLGGSLNTLNAALATVQYTGTALYYGHDTITVAVDDLGHTGAGGALTHETTADILLVPTLLVVTLLNDELDGDFSPGKVNLREAVTEIAENGTIRFDNALTGTIVLRPALGPLTIAKSLVIEGSGSDQITVSGGLVQRVFVVDDGDESPNRDVAISSLTLADGSAGAGGNGGAVFNAEILTLDQCRILGSTAENGGGVSNQGALVLRDCMGSGNTATDAGGFVVCLAGSTLRINGTTITQNAASRGGGVMNLGTAVLVNSTISGNRAVQNGGGFDQGAVQAAVLVNCTVTGNVADHTAVDSGDGGGVHVLGGAAPVSLRNTLIVGNIDRSGSGSVHPDVSGVFAAGQNNIIGYATGATGFGDSDIVLADEGITDTSVVLDPVLADNGGLTLTHALALFSPAVNAGNNAFITEVYFEDTPFHDQRGAEFPRITRDTVDVGAYELQAEDSGPLTVAIQRVSGQYAQTAFLPIMFDIVFNEFVQDFTEDDILFVGTATNIVYTLEWLGAGHYRLTVTNADPGTIIPRILPVSDSFGGTVQATAGPAGTVAYDTLLDQDSDGILDIDEGNGDADNDGQPDFLEVDADADGVPDSVESDIGSDPYDHENPDATLHLSPAAFVTGPESGTVDVTVQRYGSVSFSWTAAVTQGAEWADIVSGATGQDTGTIRIAYQANTTQQARTSIVTVDAPGASQMPRGIVIEQAACYPPGLVANATAVLGGQRSSVQITWSAAEWATAYDVYGTPEAEYAGASYLGTTLDTAITISDAGFNCIGNLLDGYTYWVVARNDCAESDPVRAIMNAKEAIIEPVLPSAKNEDGTYRAHADVPLAIRLISTEPILPETLEITVEGGEHGEILWQPVNGAVNDGWVVCYPPDTWAFEQVLTITAHAMTADGVFAGPVSATFVVESEADYTQRLSAAVENGKGASVETTAWLGEETAPVMKPLVENAPVYVIGPDQVFAQPQVIWVPAPARQDPKSWTLWYYSQERDAWYPANEVQGLLTDTAPQVLENEGGLWLGFEVNHGGSVQLAPKQASVSLTAASLISWPPKHVSDLLILVLVAAVLMQAGFRSRRISSTEKE
ncbi:MAG TPA: Ig-like domain-containing protein [Candidatus Hydrogenedentes bacterium]|nr:Ig-like domain-containing protein [Candidatus Hydrogenedentota bacterium]